MVNNLANICKEEGKEFIDKLFNTYTVVYEQIDGSRFLFQKLKNNDVVFYKRDNETINHIDRTLMKFYENAIKHVENLPIEVKANIPDNWTFGFQYFPSSAPINIAYDKMPKNNMILTDISVRNESGKVIKVIHDPKVLKDWAERLDTEKPPIIFNGKLSDYQKEQLKRYLETPDEDLYQLFKTTSFTKYIISILNPVLTSSMLMNDLEKSIEGIIFKFINPGKSEVVSARLVDPTFACISKTIPAADARKSNDMYQIVMLDIIEFFEQIDLNKIALAGTSPEERYVELVSVLFNEYVANNGHKYFGIDFESPDFSKRPEFDINMEFVKNPRTRELIQNDHLRNLYKIMLSSFRKHRKRPTDILTQSIIENINDIVDKIESIVVTNEKSFDGALDFESFIKKTTLQERVSNYEQEIFEGLSLTTTKQGKKKVNIFVGRFQPFTLGHAKVFETLHKENKLPVVVIIVRSGKKPDERAPFNEDMQMQMFGEMKKEYKYLEAIFVTTNAAIDSVYNQLRPAYEPVLWGTGTDRFKSYQNMIAKYSDELNALPELEAYEIKRGDEDISATKVRNALKIDDFETFAKMTPKSIHRLYKELKYVVEQTSESKVVPFIEFINESTKTEPVNKITHVFNQSNLENKPEE